MLPIFGLFGLGMGWLILALLTSGVGLLLVPVYVALWKVGKDKRAEQAMAHLRAILMTDERVIGSALQLPLCAVWNRRKLLALTNERVLVISRSLWGAFQIRDAPWDNLRDVIIAENLVPAKFGADLAFQLALPGEQLHVSGIASDVAATFSAEARMQARTYEEKRRVLAEEKRAASGGTHIGGAQRRVRER
jgi:hypothetical protein